MSLSITMLRTFKLVAESGNLADAAASLARTPSAVSMTLKQMEDHLSAKLFESDRKNRLTPLGKEIFELAQHQIQSFDDCIHTIETAAKTPQGLLRIASIPSAAHGILPKALTQLTRKHPKIRIEMRDADSTQVIEALIRGEVDVGIASGTRTLNGIQQELLLEDAFGLVCARHHRLAHQANPPSMKEVTAAGFVSNNLCDALASPSVKAHVASAQLSVLNTLSLIGIVKTGDWVTLLPETVIQLAPEELAFRHIADVPDKRRVCVFFRERSLYPHLVDDLRTLLIQNK